MIKNLWTDNISKAKKIQDELRRKVKIIPLQKTPLYIAGVDAAFMDDVIIAVASLYKYPELIPLQDAVSREKLRFPYVPGLLSFREGPAVIKALGKLKIQPDVILFDGQGIAHPKGIGIASHIGVILNIPTIGCAKSRLTGEFEEPDAKKGSRTYLHHNDQRVGAVLRTRTDVKPLFVSPGHLIDILSSIDIVMKCTCRFRIPEPLRRADHLSKKFKLTSSF
jgi:deoxyribonuclease V